MGRTGRLLAKVPACAWLKTYTPAIFTVDLIAAVIVTVMLVPQSLAYALLAGLPPQAGLYASMAPLLAYALLGSSRVLAVGPVAVISLMTAEAVGRVAVPYTPAYAEAALVLALLSGLLLWAIGLARLGFIANFLSRPVVTGFVTASSVLIAAGQLRHILGVGGGGSSLVAVVGSLLEHLPHTNASTLAIGATTLVALWCLRARLRSWLLRLGMKPRLADLLGKCAPLAAVAGGIGAVSLLGLTEQGVKVVGDVPSGLPPLTLPAFDLPLWRELLPAALLIGIVGFAESVAVGQTLAGTRRQRIDPGHELAGLGAANVAAAFTGGYPVTGGFARSVVNHQAGAETPMAGVMTAGGIALVSLYLTPLIRDLPQATLAATIIVAVLSLADFGALKRAYLYSRGDFAAMAVTVVAVLALGVEAGLLAGMGVSILVLLARASRPRIAVVGKAPGVQRRSDHAGRDRPRGEPVLSIRVEDSLCFANARFLEEEIDRLVSSHPGARHVVLLCRAVNHIDMSALESLEAVVARLEASRITLHLAEVQGHVLDGLRRSRLLEQLTGTVFLTHYDAVRALAASDAAARHTRHPPAVAAVPLLSPGFAACERVDRVPPA